MRKRTSELIESPRAGILLQSDIDPTFHLLTAAGTQAGVASWNPGAWVVSDMDPTPVDAMTWGAMKKEFRQDFRHSVPGTRRIGPTAGPSSTCTIRGHPGRFAV